MATAIDIAAPKEITGCTSCRGITNNFNIIQVYFFNEDVDMPVKSKDADKLEGPSSSHGVDIQTLRTKSKYVHVFGRNEEQLWGGKCLRLQSE